MSSHREAPEISKDPVADSTDLYAFVSSGRARHRHDDRQLHPAAEPGRRAELLRVRRRRALRDPHRQQRRRQGRHHVPVPVQDRGHESGHVPLQHRADPVARQTRTGTAARPTRSTRIDGNERQDGPRCGTEPAASPPVQHRAAVDAELRRRWPTRPSIRSPAAGRCSPASGPRASTSISARSSTSATCGRSSSSTRTFGLAEHRARRDGRGRERDQGRQRALDRAPGAEVGAHARAAQTPTDVDRTRHR